MMRGANNRDTDSGSDAGDKASKLRNFV